MYVLCVYVCVSGLTFSKLQKYDIGIIWALVIVFWFGVWKNRKFGWNNDMGQSGRRDIFCAKWPYFDVPVVWLVSKSLKKGVLVLGFNPQKPLILFLQLHNLSVSS